MNELLVVVTMDCEPPNAAGLAGVTGPANWGESEDFIKAYCDISSEYGFPVSLFLHPEVAVNQSSLLFELERSGHCISGLHLHPWKYDPETALTHLGHMPYGPQRELMERAVGEWAQGLGRRPQYFRPGTFSANDATPAIMLELGFSGGSISVPGRMFPDLGAVWVGCPTDPHRLHPGMRLLPGDMPLPNMPLTVDTSQVRYSGIRSWHPDLRPDQHYDDIRSAVKRVVEQIITRAPSILVFNIVTHNDNDYTDPANSVRINLETILISVNSASDELGLICRGATIKDVCDKVASSPVEPPGFVRA